MVKIRVRQILRTVLGVKHVFFFFFRQLLRGLASFFLVWRDQATNPSMPTDDRNLVVPLANCLEKMLEDIQSRSISYCENLWTMFLHIKFYIRDLFSGFGEARAPNTRPSKRGVGRPFGCDGSMAPFVKHQPQEPRPLIWSLYIVNQNQEPLIHIDTSWSLVLNVFGIYSDHVYLYIKSITARTKTNNIQYVYYII